MSAIILSKNYFLRIALSSLLISRDSPCRLLFIDIDSFKNMNSILEALEESDVGEETKICFIGTPGVVFQVLLPLKIISLNDLLDVLGKNFSIDEFSLINESLKYLRRLQGLTMLTRRQRECIIALTIDGEVRSACKQLCISEKAFYGRLRKAGEKINLFNLAQLKVYLSNNYKRADICKDV